MKGLIIYDRAIGTSITLRCRRRRNWESIGLSTGSNSEIRQKQKLKQTQNFVRYFASVYTVGHGWTGALGTGRLDQEISGHFDEEEDLHESAQSGTVPIKIYDGIIKSCSIGWAHTSLVVEPGYDYDENDIYNNYNINNNNYATMTNHPAGTISAVAPYNHEHELIIRAKRQNHVLVTGRAHDFSNLFRLRRLPKFARDFTVKQTLRTAQANSEADMPLLDFTRIISYFADLMNITSKNDWDGARRVSALANFTRVDEMYIESKYYDDDPTKDMATTPLLASGIEDDAADDKDEPIEVFCSAGVTTILMKSGCLYSMGVNIYGQCGVGYTSNNVWFPERVPGLSTEPAPAVRSTLQQSYPITSVALGLQHGLCLNTEGEMFTWGKANRGQLGRPTEEWDPTPSPIEKVIVKLLKNGKPIYQYPRNIRQISAGMMHNAALDYDNNVYVWGKHLMTKLPGFALKSKKSFDAKVPIVLGGLPPHLQVEQISCGSHHTSVLMEDGSVWATGISKDTKQLILEATCIVPPGIIEMPVRYFAAHMDRTTIVGYDGRQVYQVHLWSNPEYKEWALFTPVWINNLLESDPNLRINEIHRSWMHSVAVTE